MKISEIITKKYKLRMPPTVYFELLADVVEVEEDQVPMSVIEDIKAEIEAEYGSYDICEYYEDYDYEENDISEYQYVGTVADIINIIDKHCGKEQNNV